MHLLKMPKSVPAATKVQMMKTPKREVIDNVFFDEERKVTLTQLESISL